MSEEPGFFGTDRLFGTDGVRARAGEGYLSDDNVKRLVAAIALVLKHREPFGEEIPAERGSMIVIGRDTRASGVRLLEIVADEFLRLGHPVGDLGVLPTAGAAFVAQRSKECCLAIVLSASHNPAEDNGIKLLAPIGAKISPEFEEAVSAAFFAGPELGAASARASFVDLSEESLNSYVEFLVSRAWNPERFAGKKIVLDAAQGAAYKAAPAVFRALGMEVECIGIEPDGLNINDGCGATHPEMTAKCVRDVGALLGFCFDGDADRMIPVTSSGRILDGDHVLALAGRGYLRRGLLPKKTVVATVMSNLGLEKSLEDMGLDLLRTDVGDRHVYREMREKGHPFGGEQSGHLIFVDDFLTGDGILAAIRLLDVLEGDDLDLEAESRCMKQYPQILRNVRVKEKAPLEGIPSVVQAIAGVESALSGEGRVLVRYSGTEALARVMLEGPDEESIRGLCDQICRAIELALPT